MSDREVEAFWKDAWTLLDAEQPEKVLALARGALAEDPEMAEAHFMAGVAESELDEPVASLEHHAQAAMLAPEWDEAVVMHMGALFRTCRFAECREILEALENEPPELALHFHLAGLLAERAGDDAAAMAAFSRASELDPEAYPPWSRIPDDRFEAVMEAALEKLPEEFREALAHVAIVVEAFPDEHVLTAADPPHDPELLGLYVGTPLTSRSVEASGDSPDVVHLFQRNLERYAPDAESLEREITITLYHELAHALGFEEEDMPDLGLE